MMGVFFINQELEIEFKNMLTYEEYQSILSAEFSSSDKQMIVQTNHYFDTIDFTLRNHGAALRIRVTDTFNELTLKVPHEGFLMETNVPLSNEEVEQILDKQALKLSSYLDSDIETGLDDLSKDIVFMLFNSVQTERLEKTEDIHTVVLDQTSYQDGTVDYELEVESLDSELGRQFFESFLEKYSIPARPSLPKIARAENYK